MSSHPHVLALLENHVPLALLFDLAGFAASSQELYRSEPGADPGGCALPAAAA